jgi:hypothetical protein
MLLRLKRGSFSGRLVVLGMFGMVVYSFVDVGLTISIDVLGNSNAAGYELGLLNIVSDLSTPIMWIALLWITMTIVRALQSKQAQSDRYWGI